MPVCCRCYVTALTTISHYVLLHARKTHLPIVCLSHRNSYSTSNNVKPAYSCVFSLSPITHNFFLPSPIWLRLIGIVASMQLSSSHDRRMCPESSKRHAYINLPPRTINSFSFLGAMYANSLRDRLYTYCKL